MLRTANGYPDVESFLLNEYLLGVEIVIVLIDDAAILICEILAGVQYCIAMV